MRPGTSSDHRRRRDELAPLWGACLVWAWAATSACAGAPAVAGAGAPAPVDFRRDVLPILSNNCFLCHGPDAKARKADLRLDIKQGALRAADPVIVPGQSAESELIARITSDDAEEMMPPPK